MEADDGSQIDLFDKPDIVSFSIVNVKPIPS
jgi:hypothetical protein